VPSFTRVIEHLTATVERGTPIADVLAAQIADAREEAKNRLVESAGRNEVMMLIPLVFLILPVTIAFAVFPGLIAIQSGL
jgi:tight adherence protein C